MPSYQGINDDALPLTPNSELQQYDPYCIYDLVSIDIVSTTVSSAITQTTTQKNKDWLAIQAYSPFPVLCDFNSIVNQYK